jgi:hypothetical protein
MASSTPSVSNIVTAVTLKVTSAGTPSTVEQTFNDPATLASLKVGHNSLSITNSEILSRYATVGLQCSNVLSVTYGGLISVSTPTSTPIFVATPITLSNFGPFNLDYVSGGTFKLPQPTSNSNSPGAFTYSVPANNGVVSISGNVVTMLAAGSTTITAIQAAAGGYASSTPIDANVTLQQQRGFSQVTDSAFTNLNFDSDMTTLFTEQDSMSSLISMPNSNFIFGGNPYSVVYLSSEGALYFNTQQYEYSYGMNNQLPVSSFRFFGFDHMSTGSYKFDSNNTRLLVKLTGYAWSDPYKLFTIKLIIEQSGNITTNYTIGSAYTAYPIIIGYVGSNSDIKADDIFLTLDGVTFDGSTYLNLFSLLNGKTILYIPVLLPDL